MLRLSNQSLESSKRSDDAAVLLRRFAEGDDGAFTELVDMVGPRLFGFLCRFVGNRTQGEDLYQDVLVKVARNADHFDGRARFETWLYRIARNACIDHIRKAGRSPLVVLPNRDDGHNSAGFEQMEGSSAAPDSRLDAEELGQKIHNALEALPDEQREVFLLKEQGRLTFDEVGEVLGCGKETAKSRMRYALTKLRSHLQREARLYGVSGVDE